MKRTEVLAAFQSGSLRMAPKLQRMVATYIEAVNSGIHTPAKLLRHGQRLLNDTFKRADGGCEETLASMRSAGINAITLATAAELFGVAADAFEAGVEE